MSHWIDFTVYAVFLVTFWFVCGIANWRWPLMMLADRNPDWLCAHPDVARRMLGVRWDVWGGYALGALSLAVLVAFQLGLSPFQSSPLRHWHTLWVITVASGLIGGIYCAVGGSIRARQWKRLVPLAQRRVAALERRSLDDFVPPFARHATYAVVIIHAAAWILAGILDLYSTDRYWGQFADVAILSIAFSLVYSFTARVIVNRPPHVLDRLLGPGYRREEVRLAFFPQLLPPAVGAVALYQELAGLTVIDVKRGMYLGLTLLITAGFLRALAAAKASGVPPARAASIRSS